MKSFFKSTLLICAVLFSSALYAKDSSDASSSAYQITRADETLKQLVERWAKKEDMAFEWNATYDISINHEPAAVKAVNEQLAKVEDLHDAVMLILELTSKYAPALRKLAVAPLDFCYYQEESVYIYTTDQPNCGHAEPVASAEDDE